MDSIADEAVIATNDDAALCKYQAVLKGYYSDAYLDKLLSSKAKTSAPRKAPEINRGYYARSTSIAFIVEKFIEANPNGQIISLGAGYDTLFWRLKDHNFIHSPAGDEDATRRLINYVEIDMSPVVVHKIMAIKRHRELATPLGQFQLEGECLHSANYHLISSDLRQVDKKPLQDLLFQKCKLDSSRATLCLAECVLVYMPTHDSESLIRWLSEQFTDLAMVNYEQCNMEDRFGEIMLANMTARHCDLMGVEACKSLESQTRRFKSNGLTSTLGWTLLDILNKCLLPDLVRRMNQIEFLDEKELLEQLLEHYCIVIGSQKEINWMNDQEYWLSKTTNAPDKS